MFQRSASLRVEAGSRLVPTHELLWIYEHRKQVTRREIVDIDKLLDVLRGGRYEALRLVSLANDNLVGGLFLDRDGWAVASIASLKT